MKIKLLFILLITFQPLVFGANDIPERPLYLDPSQSVQTRVENLMSLMTLKEKVAQMCQYVGLEHMRDAEKNITEEELLNGHARGFYKDCTPQEWNGWSHREKSVHFFMS